jgi:hypothetical protein
LRRASQTVALLLSGFDRDRVPVTRLVYKLSSKAEIANFDFCIVVEKDVLGFEVSVDEVVLMNRYNSLYQLFEDL